MIKIIRDKFLFGKHSFHTSAILYSKKNPQNTSTSTETVTGSSSQNSVLKQLRERNQRLLQEEQTDRKTIFDQNDQIIKLLNEKEPKNVIAIEEDVLETLEIKSEDERAEYAQYNLKKPENIKSVEEKEIKTALETEIDYKVNIDIDTPENMEKLKAYRKNFRARVELEEAENEYKQNPTEIKSQKVEKIKQKYDSIINELVKLKEISKSDIGEIFINAYNLYVEYLESLTPDKIVCLFNIIIGGITLSSFLSVLSIMLSDNIINRIKFLDKYPRILKLLKLRNNINRKVAKFHLLMHFIWIVAGLLCNIYMFFI